MEYLNTNHYFTCTSGLAPAQMSNTQTIIKHGEGKYPLLTKQSTATASIGDFFCRWTLVLAAAVAALGVVTGGAALLVLGAAVLASGLMCGALLAGTRQWINTKQNHTINGIETLTARAQMICPVIGGTITMAPGIDSTWKALLFTARNTTWALAEGYFIGYTMAGGGGALMAGGTATGKYFLGNFLLMQGAARTIGAADQVLFEGMLRNGESFGDAVQENAVTGLTMFEQPFINFYRKLNGDIKDPQGNPVPLNWQDFYGMALSALGTREMARVAAADVNMPKETVAALKGVTEKIGNKLRGKVYETVQARKPVLSKDGKTAKELAYEEMQRRLDNVKNKEINPKTGQPYGKSHVPSSLEVAVNKKTGEVLIGENRTLNKGNPPPELHPKTKEKFTEGSKENWNERNCSEADVAEQIHRRGESGEDYEYHAVEVDSNGTVQDKHTCRNCDVNMKDEIDRGDVTSNTPESKARRDEMNNKKGK
ncbi:hypothetical protein [Chitinophaga sp.]|uniref:hypothetical protein n=1 Tax=Chitinophaga sp. TaxID=1869181 RepID=UPI0031E233F8